MELPRYQDLISRFANNRYPASEVTKEKEIEMRFEDDKPVECEYCRRMIYAGDCALVWNKKYYCSEDCVKDAMYEDADVSEHYVMTAEDKKEVYGDMMYDEMRGE